MAGEMRRERKVVTALFADLVGSTALTESMDPEDAMEVLGAAISEIVLVVEDLGGTVKDLAGDGVLALFGAPVAHEDDVERAVHAGLRIVDLFAGGRAGIDVRVGIETGLVVLGPVGAGSHIEYGATGDTVNSAARLQAAAEPGSVLVGATARRLAEHSFEWGERRQLTLKGKAAPVAAWPVTSAVIGAVVPGSTVALVGRRPELAVVSEAVAAALRGESGLLVVVGDGGVGKSRLLEEARTTAPRPASEFRWVVLAGASYEQDVPFAPLRRLLGGWLGIRPDTDAATAAGLARTGFARLLGADGVELDAGVELALGLPPHGSPARPERPSERGESRPEAASELGPFHVAEAVDRILAAMAARGPVVLVFEDLQWADPDTLRLVDHLVARGDDLPCLLVLTGRPEPDHPLLRWADVAGAGLRDRSWAVRLGRLAPAAAEALLGAHVGVGTLPIDLERSLLGTAEGNPFFLEELVRDLVDSGALVAGPHGWEHDPTVAFAVPPTLERLVRERLDRLADGPRRLVVTAAAIGRSFEADLLADVVGDDGQEVAVQLKELSGAGLVERGETQWRFTHPVVHDAAYNSLLRRSRGELHRHIAETMSRRDEADLAALASQWWEAGEPGKAAPLAEEAAGRSFELGHVEQAARQYELAVEASAAAGREDPRLTLRLADARRRAGLLHPALEAYERAHHLAEDAGKVDVLAVAALGYEDTFFASRQRRTEADPTIPLLEAAVRALGEEVSGRRARTLAALGRALSYLGRTTEGSAVAAEGVDLARRAGDPAAAAYALLAWRTDRLGPDCLPERVPMAEEALRHAEAAGDQEQWIEAGRALFVDLLASTRRSRADEVLARLEDRIVAAGQPFHLWYVGMWRFQQALLDGDLDRAGALAEEFRRQGRRVRYRDVDYVYAFQKLLLLRHTGGPDEVTPLFDRLAASDRSGSGRWPGLYAALHCATGRFDDARTTLDALAGIGFSSVPVDQSRPGLLALIADAVVVAGTSDQADAVAELLRPWSGQAVVVGAGAACLGAADHYLGILAQHAGRTAAARQLLGRGREQHVALGAPLLVARSDRAIAGLPGMVDARP